MKARLVVSPHRPFRGPIQFLLLVLALSVTGYLAHSYGRATVSTQFAVTADERDVLASANEALLRDNTSLRERVAILERAAQIDKKAHNEVKRNIARLQNETLALKEEVAFYRGIVSANRDEGLSIQSFEIERGAEPATYRYRLVLTQDMKSDKVVSGTVNVSVAGEQDGQGKRLSAIALGDSRSRGTEFQFKYFQKIEGQMELPRGFSPRSVLVRVMSAGSSKAVTERTFDWPEPVG